MTKTKTKWRVSSVLNDPRIYEAEHPIEAARQYVEEIDVPRFTVLLVFGHGGERRRYKVGERRKLEQLPARGDLV